MTTDVVTVSHVRKLYGRSIRAVNDVSFAIEPGETVALIGHNGAGKSTLMKLMLGITAPSSGTVRLFGGDPRKVRDGVGFLPESVAFHESLTGREALSFFARLKRIPRGEADRLLEQVGLADAASRRIKTYSKGMRQRLGLAQAMLGHPRLLLLDEPTTGLDPGLRVRFFEMLDRLRMEGTSVVFSTHALVEIERHMDRALILHEGQLRAQGTLAELRRISGAPSRIRLSLPDAERWAADLGQGGRLQGRNGCFVELVCTEAERRALIARIGAETLPLDDLEIAVPTLEDIYARLAAGPEVLT